MELSWHVCDGVLSWSPEQRGSSKPHPFQRRDADNREASCPLKEMVTLGHVALDLDGPGNNVEERDFCYRGQR